MAKKIHEKMLTISGHKGNANQTTVRFYFIPIRIATIKNTNNNDKCWRRCRKKEPSYTSGGNVI
jgi:hypothetical protein